MAVTSTLDVDVHAKQSVLEAVSLSPTAVELYAALTVVDASELQLIRHPVVTECVKAAASESNEAPTVVWASEVQYWVQICEEPLAMP
jgi:hypothetical protein